jgi:molybdenum cofactor cytidylyltransferase
VIAGILLAAGASRRFGSQKLVAPLRGAPLVRWSAERLLAAPVDEVIVVLGRDGDAVRAALDGLGVRTVENAHAHDGMSTSLAAGIRALDARTEAALIALGDQPAVPRAVYARLIDEFREHGAPIVAPVYADGTRGNPVLFASSVFPELLLVRGDQGARSIIEAEPGRVRLVRFSLPQPLDVDTVEELGKV